MKPRVHGHSKDYDNSPQNDSRVVLHAAAVHRSDASRSFASRKFDLLDAINGDPRIRANDFRVAYALLQHMNASTGLICPSLERLAALLNLSSDTVQRSVKHLQETGWLTVSRPNRQKSNRYRFDEKNVNAMLDRRASLEDGMREQRAERARTRAQRHSERTLLRAPESAALPGKHP